MQQRHTTGSIIRRHEACLTTHTAAQQAATGLFLFAVRFISELFFSYYYFYRYFCFGRINRAQAC